MNTSEYSMTCSCGDELKVEAKSQQEAISKLQRQEDEKAIKAHFMEKHPGQPIPSVAEVHEMIAKNLEMVTV